MHWLFDLLGSRKFYAYMLGVVATTISLVLASQVQCKTSFNDRYGKQLKLYGCSDLKAHYTKGIVVKLISYGYNNVKIINPERYRFASHDLRGNGIFLYDQTSAPSQTMQYDLDSAIRIQSPSLKQMNIMLSGWILKSEKCSVKRLPDFIVMADSIKLVEDYYVEE